MQMVRVYGQRDQRRVIRTAGLFTTMSQQRSSLPRRYMLQVAARPAARHSEHLLSADKFFLPCNTSLTYSFDRQKLKAENGEHRYKLERKVHKTLTTAY